MNTPFEGSPLAAVPPLDRMALLLDVDGTLLEFAPTPDSVKVPPSLPPLLGRLNQRLDGALGVITGRPVAQIDDFLGPVVMAVAGEHGAAIRHAPQAALERADLPCPPAAWWEQAQDVAARFPGVVLEPKQRGFALHYRNAPEAGNALRLWLDEQVGPQNDAFEILAANMAWELRPRGVDKGTALREIMARAPFAGRVPVFVGDDVTDKDAIYAAEALGGVGFFVPEVFGSPQRVRDWLAQLDGESL